MELNHLAIILDGNGRWAKSKGLPRNYGHIEGAKNVERIIDAADDLGIKYVTMYAFSTENWKRPKAEVAALMKLLRNYLKTCRKTCQKHNMRIRVIGDKDGLPEDIRKQIREAEAFSEAFTGLNFQIAINYGSRDEIRRAVTKIAEDVKAGEVAPEEITEEKIASYLDTADLPDPDLLIRTSGEERLSNYLLWQLAYAEFYFTEVPWPAFSRADLEKAVMSYKNRDRRYGKIREE